MKIEKATHTGKLIIGDIEFECAVLEDRTRVISETRFMEAMGMYRSGALSVRRKSSSAPIPLFLAHKNLKAFADKHLGSVHFKLLPYRNEHGNLARGIPAKVLPKICEVWIDAKRSGVLGRRQVLIAEKADLLLRGCAHVGIIALVDEATGYQEIRDRKALQTILDKYLLAERAKWAKRFPDEFYKEIFRLRDWEWQGMKVNRPSVVGHYTNDIIWDRLAPGVHEELKRLNPKTEQGRRKSLHPQWLTEDIGHAALQKHLNGVIVLMRSVVRAKGGWDEFRRRLQRVFPKINTNLDLPLEDE